MRVTLHAFDGSILATLEMGIWEATPVIMWKMHFFLKGASTPEGWRYEEVHAYCVPH